MNAPLTAGRRFALLVAAAALLFAMLPATPAGAGPGIATLQGQVTFDQALGGGDGGTALFIGTTTTVHGTSPRVLVPVMFSFTYNDPSIAFGTATGSIVTGGGTCGFDWLRIGAAAVVQLDDGCTGAGAVALVPQGLPGSAHWTASTVWSVSWVH